jgi:flagellar biosynthetic protein FlhB
VAEQDDDFERTEEPSFKKLEEAAKRGDVAKSQEVVTWFMLLAATVALFSFSGDMLATLATGLSRLIEHSHEISFDAPTMHRMTTHMLLVAAGAVAIPAALFMVAGIAGNLVQHRPVWSFNPIEPKLNKISPVAGFKRLFSLQSLINFAKGLAKVMIVGTIMVVVLWPQRGVLGDLVTTDPAAIMPLARLLSLKVFGAALGVLTLVAALDYAYQRHRWYERQRMTVKEVRDEYRQMEGDPTVRAKLRQVRIERGRKRMMQERAVRRRGHHQPDALLRRAGI